MKIEIQNRKIFIKIRHTVFIRVWYTYLFLPENHEILLLYDYNQIFYICKKALFLYHI